MCGQEPETIKKHLCIGILAHVDAGKTTLSEGLLYLCGEIRRIGRVDHGDAFLDTFELERERGITIFSKQARLKTPEVEITLLDTPGHVDFSAEMERTLQVLDYAILVISGADGVQGHTMTLWRLLEQYQIPVFLFINKMDQEGTDRETLLLELKKRLHENCTDFSEEDSEEGSEEFLENVAVCEETVLEHYLDTGVLPQEEIVRLIGQRKVFPCYFGSALKMTGVENFLKGLLSYTKTPDYPETFGAKVYKIARDKQGNRLTYMKITGGSLKVKETISGRADRHMESSPMDRPDGQSTPPGELWEEKIDQIRLYSGAKFDLLQEAEAGRICAVTGLTQTYPGQGLGSEEDSPLPVLEPVLNYQLLLPAECDVHQMLRKLRQLQEEDPQLHIVWNEALSQIHVMLMGEVQTEILKSLIWERFHVAVSFDTGQIVYKETIAAPVTGVGHFEPLRHYAEVHLLLEPGERGSGMQFFTACSEDVLDRNWQRLILTHLEEKEHKGVLTGAPVTDLQITLLTGRAHLKHTEGGDFRQATYRAVRQGLKKARSILLEPYYEFRLEVPAELVGRAMTDIQNMQGTMEPLQLDQDTAVLKGTAPVCAMRNYQKQVAAYTGGRGRLFCALKGYAPCADTERIVQEIGYDAERDLENPTGSVFCAHGAGFVVPWYQVEEYMHLESGQAEEYIHPERGQGAWEDAEEPDFGGLPGRGGQAAYSGQAGRGAAGKKGASYMGSYEDEKELQAIFERTFGPVKRHLPQESRRTVCAPQEIPERYRPRPKQQEEYLLVDGYNIIFSWEELRDLAGHDVHAAQERLMDILSDYQGLKKCTLILVFDAYKVEGHREEVLKYHNIYVVYTREAETADQYIERTVHKIGRQNQVTVATSDGLEQIIILGQGAVRISASGLWEEILGAKEAALHEWKMRRQSSKQYLLDQVPEDVADYIKELKNSRKEQSENE